MTRETIKLTYAILFGVALFAGCSGGGIKSGGANSNTASEAPLQMITYELFRNWLVGAFGVTEGGPTLEFVDQRAALFGGQQQGSSTRDLSYTVARGKAIYDACNLACVEALEENPDKIFPDASSPLNAQPLCEAILGRPVREDEQTLLDDVAAVDGYRDTAERQLGLCMACCVNLRAHIQ